MYYHGMYEWMIISTFQRNEYIYIYRIRKAYIYLYEFEQHFDVFKDFNKVDKHNNIFYTIITS